MAFLSAGAGGECTEDEGISGTGINGNGADEVDEVEMGDTIERRFPFLFKCPYQILFASTFHSLPLQVIPYTDTPKLSITDTMAQKKTQRWTKNMASDFGIVVGIETAGGLAELGAGPSGSAGNKWKAEVVIINYWIMNDMGIYTFLTSFLFNYSLFLVVFSGCTSYLYSFFC